MIHAILRLRARRKARKERRQARRSGLRSRYLFAERERISSRKVEDANG